MGFSEAVKTCLRKYVTFSGRATRPEFWWFVLFFFLVIVIGGVIDLVLFGESTTAVTDTGASVGSETDFTPFTTIFGLLILLPYISVAVRRLHDTGRSGWWYWLGLIPLVGIIILIVWFASKGTTGSNKYGEDPQA
ncbi:DUF805 domain-containing protein [Pseudooceanicola sp.]|uniref:DUF805 domain-containing protein n=1 Tax=Pseudooceanicola sp. TaxID=1914328 RepID=UPI0035C6DE4A